MAYIVSRAYTYDVSKSRAASGGGDGTADRHFSTAQDATHLGTGTGRAVALESGIAALSMCKLGDVVGVEAMSLYDHVANKDELLDRMVDPVTDQIEDRAEIRPGWVMRNTISCRSGRWWGRPTALELALANAAWQRAR